MTKAISQSRVSRRLRFRDLEVLFAVMQCGSMAKAAAELGVTQPAVSEVIAELEQAFAVRLFDRSPHGVVPTIYGRALETRKKSQRNWSASLRYKPVRRMSAWGLTRKNSV